MMWDWMWDNPPAPFNPSFDLCAAGRSSEATRLVDAEEAQSGSDWTLDERRERWDELYRVQARKQLYEAAPDLLAALVTLVDHAREQYPHFESERGQRDIEAAEIAIAKTIP